ncbi:hypothetical protein BVER_02277c [Candidatus Burkholderia verschuerenii]|uniref:Retrotransposon gag domain-containing protein n=1 Tax=Candidatus Burkholderia verschuerenii TaxID=242163 RepID=A0A0L0M296_9BURK|nr:retrotransposon gag family protein [Candidatus Burkholderia verschuerenii]KND56782.1 hypothetical protein BVER_02277c [Candidatus Burkholderia verschuerenii]
MENKLDQLTSMLAAMNKRMEAMELNISQVQHSQSKASKSRVSDEDEEESDGSTKRGSTSKLDSSLNSIKLKIPAFSGKDDPEVYLDWVDQVDSIYAVHKYSEEKKMQLAVVEFTGYARSWWNKVLADKRRFKEAPFFTWDEMKKAMRKRFVPNYYIRDLFNQLQRITQGNRSVSDYNREIEVALTRLQIDEDPEAAMARFLGGLKREIANVVELQEYEDVEEMFQKALKVEKQLKDKSVSRPSEATPHLLGRILGLRNVMR